MEFESQFGLLMTVIPIYVFSKFEIYIFKIALVINGNVHFSLKSFDY